MLGHILSFERRASEILTRYVRVFFGRESYYLLFSLVCAEAL